MTTQELVTELRASLGNRTDLTDDRYVSWLNWALLDLCGFHRKRAFAPKRFHTLEGKHVFKTILETGTVGAGSDLTQVRLSGGSIDADHYNDMVIVFASGQKALIYDYAGAGGNFEAYPIEDFDTIPVTGEAWTAYRRYYDLFADVGLSPITNIWSILKIEKASTGSLLSQVTWDELTGADFTTTLGEPSKFARQGSALVFDSLPDEVTAYRIYYYRYPSLLSTLYPLVEPEIPVDWHEILLQGAVWRGFEKLMEPDRQSEAFDKYVAEATNKRDDFEFASTFITKGVKIRR